MLKKTVLVMTVICLVPGALWAQAEGAEPAQVSSATPSGELAGIPKQLRLPATGAYTPGWSSDLSVGVGWLFAEAGFTIEDYGFKISELTWPVDGPYGQARGHLQYTQAANGGYWGAGIRGSFAGASGIEGTGTDEDWDDFGYLWLYSESDTEVDVSIYDIDLYLVTRPFDPAKSSFMKRFEFSLGLGWGEQRFEMLDSNMSYKYDYGLDRGVVSGEISSYDLTVNGVRLSMGTRFDFSDRIDLSAELVWMPYIKAKGEGNWILRDYLFTQTADGMGLSARVQADVLLTSNAGLYGAMQASQFTADKNGLESGHEAGDLPYSGESIVGEITASTIAFEIGGFARF